MKTKFLVIGICMLLFATTVSVAIPIKNNTKQINTSTIDSSSSIATGDLSFSGARKLVRASDGTLYAVYSRIDNSKYNIFCSFSTDEGVSWQETEITHDLSFDQKTPSVAIDSNNNVHVVWSGPNGTGYVTQIRYRMYDGSAWSQIVNLTSEINYQKYPCIAVDGNDKIHVVWGTNGYQLRYICKTGSSWSNVEVIIPKTENILREYPSIAVDASNNIHVVCTGGNDVSYVSKTGSTWGSAVFLSHPSPSTTHRSPCIVVDSTGDVHVIWRGYFLSSGISINQVHYIKKVGSTWTPIMNITNETQNYVGMYLSIAIDGDDNLYIVWQGKHTNSTVFEQIRLRKYDGSSWGAVENLTSGDVIHQYPNLIYSLYPRIYGARTNVPKTGFALVYQEGTTATYYASEDLIWSSNLPPNTPDTPQGPTEGLTKIDYTFTSRSVDPDGDQVWYRWKFGTYTTGWLGPYESGIDVSVTHNWTSPEISEVKVKVKDNNVESDWSPALSITIFQTALEISDITGGWLKVNTGINNTGNNLAENLHWSITVKGGLLGLINVSKSDTTSLSSMMGLTCSAGPIIGFGPVSITVTASADDVKEVTKTAEGFVFFAYVFIK